MDLLLTTRATLCSMQGVYQARAQRGDWIISERFTLWIMKLSDLRCSGLRVFRFRLIISARFRYSKIVQTFWCIVIFHLNRMEVRHARQVWSNDTDRRAWGAGSSRSLGIGERARSIGNRRCAELLATLIARAVSNLSAEHWPPPQQPLYGSDGDRRKSPERATRC